MTEQKKGCGCGNKEKTEEKTAQHGCCSTKETPSEHSGCGCGGKGKRHGVRTENTPADAPDDASQGRAQLGLRGI